MFENAYGDEDSPHASCRRRRWPMPDLIYGVRGPDPRNTVVKANDREHAEDMASDFPGDVVVVSEDGGRTWTPAEEATDG